MARPKVYDYDTASDEAIVTEGVEGAKLAWFGIDPDRQIVHIVCNEGDLVTAGDDLDTVTRRGQQINLEGADFITFYTANKTLIDDLHRVVLNAWASEKAKTGTVIES
jgi:hypothetical protein